VQVISRIAVCPTYLGWRPHAAFQHLPNTWPEPKKSQNHFLIYDPFELAFFDNKNAFHHVHGRRVGEIYIDVEKKHN
jgi:hypothetical protein